jgi:hypothetical protein
MPWARSSRASPLECGRDFDQRYRKITLPSLKEAVEIMDNKHAHLQMIQGVINRQSQNSFLLKGWSVVLISAMFALAAREANPIFVYLAYFPASVFWGLDGYFLWQERTFRALYNKIRIQNDRDIDFSMDTREVRHEAKDWVRSVFFPYTDLLSWCSDRDNLFSYIYTF